MALYNADVQAETKDEQKFKDFLAAKYEKKRYVSLSLFSIVSNQIQSDFSIDLISPLSLSGGTWKPMPLCAICRR